MMRDWIRLSILEFGVMSRVIPIIMSTAVFLCACRAFWIRNRGWRNGIGLLVSVAALASSIALFVFRDYGTILACALVAYVLIALAIIVDEFAYMDVIEKSIWKRQVHDVHAGTYDHPNCDWVLRIVL